MDQNRHDDGEEEVNPEQRGALLDVRDGGSGEPVVEHGGAGAEVEREEDGEGEGGGARHAAVVAAELHEEENQEAAGGADGGDVEEVVDVSVPRGEGVAAVVAGGRRRRREGLSHRKLGFAEPKFGGWVLLRIDYCNRLSLCSGLRRNSMECVRG